MILPLNNPESPSPGTFLHRVINTHRCLKSLRNWRPVTGGLEQNECGQPFLSVMLITYNHEKYIRQALDSILMQDCDFEFEINIIDDASTDSTQEIAQEYSRRFPGVVNCYFNSVNVGHLSTQLNTIRGFRTLRGRYFAILEGDDYWSDPTKLARQVLFLENNPDFVACAHNTLKVFDDDSLPPEHFLPFKSFRRNVAEMYDLVSMAGVFHLSSIVYRNVFQQNPPSCLYDQYSCEVTINMLYGVFGKFYCFDDYMSVYRVHGGGVFSGRSQERHWRFHLIGFGRFAMYLGPKYLYMFARAVRGFTRYVLLAPFRTHEVASLAASTWVLFLTHFTVSATVCFIWFPFRLVSYIKKCIGVSELLFFLKNPFCGMLMLFLAFQRLAIRMLPDCCIRWFLRAESCFPRWVLARRAMRDWILRVRSGSK